MSCHPTDYNPAAVFLKLAEQWLARKPWLQVRTGQLFEVKGTGRKPVYCSLAGERQIHIHSSARQIGHGLVRWVVEFAPAPAHLKETYLQAGWKTPGLEPGIWSVKRGKATPGEFEDYEEVVQILDLLLAVLDDDPLKPVHHVFQLHCGCEWTVRWPLHLNYERPQACPRCHEAAQKLKPATPLGRNELCWCGSGRKYKKCHLALDRMPS